MDTYNIIKTNTEIKTLLENNLKEVHLLNILNSYLPKYTYEYKKWRQTIKNESISDFILRLNKVALHAIKYNRKNIKGGFSTFVDIINNTREEYKENCIYYVKDILYCDNNFNQIIIPRSSDFISCISFHRYPPGSIFEVIIGMQIVSTFILTNENRFSLFQPINNISPICLINIQYTQCKIRSPNTILDRPIYTYGVYLNTLKRRNLAQEIIIHPYDENRNYKYSNGTSEIINKID